jgi:hypothetical protein
MNPARVNARIEALTDQHDRWWAVPEALAEAMTLWGEGANEHGVFCTYERIEIAKTPHAHAAVLIAEGGNARGRFGHGPEYGCVTGDCGGSPTARREAFGSRDEAKAAAVADLIEPLGRGGDRRQAELLREVKAWGCSRTLFDGPAQISSPTSDGIHSLRVITW